MSAGRYVNWIGVAPSETWTLESWTTPGRLEDALGDFAGWNPVVRRLLTKAADSHDRAELYRWALYDRDPLPSWGEVTAVELDLDRAVSARAHAAMSAGDAPSVSSASDMLRNLS